MVRFERMMANVFTLEVSLRSNVGTKVVLDREAAEKLLAEIAVALGWEQETRLVRPAP